jgi:hypothetical protein
MTWCWPWWLVVVALTGAGVLGFAACFLWQWWLLSAPERQ